MNKLKEFEEALKALTELKSNLTAKITELTKELQPTCLTNKERYALEWVRAATQAKLDEVNRQLDKINAELKRTVDLLNGIDNILVDILAKLKVITDGLATQLTIVINNILGGDTSGYQELITVGTDAVNEIQALSGAVFAKLASALYASLLLDGPQSDDVRAVVTDGLGKIVYVLTQLKITAVVVVAQLTTALETDPKPTGAAKVALEALRTASQAKGDTETAQLNCIIDYVFKIAQDQADIVTYALAVQLDVVIIQLKNGIPGAHDSVQPLIDAGTKAVDNVQAELKFIVSNLWDALESSKKIGGRGLLEALAAARPGIAKAIKILAQFKDTIVSVIAKLTNELNNTNLSESVRADLIAVRLVSQAKFDTVQTQLSSFLSLQVYLDLFSKE